MDDIRRLIGAARVIIIATVRSLSAQPGDAVVNSALDPFAQAEKPVITTRVKTWTRARLEAAKKALGRGSAEILLLPATTRRAEENETDLAAQAGRFPAALHDLEAVAGI
jgi:hypothetical protein